MSPIDWICINVLTGVAATVFAVVLTRDRIHALALFIGALCFVSACIRLQLYMIGAT